MQNPISHFLHSTASAIYSFGLSCQKILATIYNAITKKIHVLALRFFSTQPTLSQQKRDDRSLSSRSVEIRSPKESQVAPDPMPIPDNSYHLDTSKPQDSIDRKKADYSNIDPFSIMNRKESVKGPSGTNFQELPPVLRKGIVNVGNTCYLSALLQCFASAKITHFRTDTTLGNALTHYLASLLDTSNTGPIPPAETLKLLSILRQSGWDSPVGVEGNPILLLDLLQEHIDHYPTWVEKKNEAFKQYPSHVECHIRRLKPNTTTQAIIDGTYAQNTPQHLVPSDHPPQFFTLGIGGRLDTPRNEQPITVSPTVKLPTHEGGSHTYRLAAVVQYIPPNHYVCLEPVFGDDNSIVQWKEFNDSVACLHQNATTCTEAISKNGHIFIYTHTG